MKGLYLIIIGLFLTVIGLSITESAIYTPLLIVAGLCLGDGIIRVARRE
jgi:hypothetical protein